MNIKSIYQSPFFFLYLTGFVSIVSFSMIFPLFPVYAKVFTANTFVIGFFASSFAIAQLLFSPLWGKLSDHVGRKPIIAGGLLGMSATFFLFALSSNLITLFISRFLQGVFAGATIPAARAYIADRTNNTERIKHMGRLGAALSLGVILGPALGGIWAQDHVSFPFLAAGVVALVDFVLVLRFLPESLDRKSENMKWKEALWDATQLHKGLRGPLTPLFLLAFLWSLTLSTNQVGTPILGFEQFHMSTQQIGMLFAFMGVVMTLTQAFLLVPATALVGQHSAIIASLLAMALGFGIMPLMPSILFLFFAMAIAAFGTAISHTLVTTLISQQTKKSQGITMGVATAFENVGRFAGPVMGGFLFRFGIQVPFFASVFIVILFLLLVITKTNFFKQEQFNEPRSHKNSPQ